MHYFFAYFSRDLLDIIEPITIIFVACKMSLFEHGLDGFKSFVILTNKDKTSSFVYSSKRYSLYSWWITLMRKEEQKRPNHTQTTSIYQHMKWYLILGVPKILLNLTLHGVLKRHLQRKCLNAWNGTISFFYSGGTHSNLSIH